MVLKLIRDYAPTHVFHNRIISSYMQSVGKVIDWFRGKVFAHKLQLGREVDSILS